MELKRGKTFIKSSLQISHEKLPDSEATGPTREDAGSCSVLTGGQQWAHGERLPHVNPSTQGYDGCPSKGVQPEPEAGTSFKLVRKSKTHDSVSGAGRVAAAVGQLVGSASFPGSSSGQRMIDYRHFVPQMPFVPAVAKSIPRKRISLKRPKKCFRNLFHIRRSKTENLASLVTEGKSLPSPRGASEAEGQQGAAFFPLAEGLGRDFQFQDLSDSELQPDSSFDLCRVLCEDVASLKSFDSLTGCGEIFADESSVPSLELNEGLNSPAGTSQDSKVLRGPSQGSAEQLASPAHEMSDFAKFWESVNHSVKQQQRALLGPWLGGSQGTDTGPPRLDAAGLAELPLCSCRDPHNSSKASSIDTGTPKSEQPESVSTSDEGYYDSFSPGLEEDKKEAPSPGTTVAAFPRDSYSGDALYELFYDPSQGPVEPSLDDDLCVSESLSGPALGAQLSMCSFHVGAEENLAPAPGPDLLSQGFLQSSWKGKECLLKLCDTELAITMGIINWLRRGPELRTSPASTPMESAVPSKGPVEKLGAGSRKLGPDPVKLEDRGSRASDAGRITSGTSASRKELWGHSGLKDPVAGESKVLVGAKQGATPPPRDPYLEYMPVSREEETQGHPKGLFSMAAAISEATDTSGKKEVPSPSAWSSSQGPRSPGNLGYFQGPWRPGLGGSTLDAEPTLTSFVAQMAALQIHPDGQHPAAQPPRQDTGSGICGQPQARDADLQQQKQFNSSPSMAAVCGLPSPSSPFHTLQDQKCPSCVLNLSQLRMEPTRLDVQAQATVGDQPLRFSSRAMGQAARRAQLDS
ncbi:PREDICTED: APC membrane recruitment protein 3 isoform X2 [Condylura cristata]|nr:PREDICTED: APC membrane recruitment protein 3 isoform X2 [Condylura cristata]XP_012583279.1 PREDICTED: APC membrane recruitment protein 3 isoform X2 [Condylura cristata]